MQWELVLVWVTEPEPKGDVILVKVLIMPNRESLHISLSFFHMVC